MPGTSWAKQAIFRLGGCLNSPSSESNSPRIILKRLVLPDPFDPTKPILLFLCTVKLTPSKRRFDPLRKDRLLKESIIKLQL